MSPRYGWCPLKTAASPRAKFGDKALRRYLKALVAVSGDATKQLLDLFALLGYFALSAYAGGYVYATTYARAFSLSAADMFGTSNVATLFIDRAILSSLMAFGASLVILLLFAAAYYSARYVWRPWFGFLSLAMIFYGCFGLCLWHGRSAARRDVARAILSDQTTLPEVQGCGLAQGSVLLTQTDGRVYALRPVGSLNSQLSLEVVNRNCGMLKLTSTPTED